MAERRVRKTGKDRDGDITSLCNDGEYWYRRGFAYYRLGETDRSRESLLRVRAVAPGSESAARADELLSVMD